MKKIKKIEKAIEKTIIGEFQRMCEESLDPKQFEMFENIKEALQKARHIP